MTVGSRPDAIETANITSCVDVGYNQRATLEIDVPQSGTGLQHDARVWLSNRPLLATAEISKRFKA